VAGAWYDRGMNFAHMVGQHHYESFSDKLSHIVTSWAGFAIAVVIGSIVMYVVYEKTRKITVKEEIKR